MGSILKWSLNNLEKHAFSNVPVFFSKVFGGIVLSAFEDAIEIGDTGKTAFKGNIPNRFFGIDQ